MAKRHISTQLLLACWPFGPIQVHDNKVPMKHECVQCHKPIPKGKQGRKCKECRDIRQGAIDK